MEFIEIYSIVPYSYKQIKRSLDLYHYCEEENILIGRDTYEKPYAVFLSDDNKVVRNITFDNKYYAWRTCILTNDGVKFLRKQCLLKKYYM